MNIKAAGKIIDELIQLSNTKYGLVKVGRDTLSNDILFIERYEKLKEILGVRTLDEIDFKELPRIKNLKELIMKINDFDKSNQNRNIRLKKATKAYKQK